MQDIGSSRLFSARRCVIYQVLIARQLRLLAFADLCAYSQICPEGVSGFRIQGLTFGFGVNPLGTAFRVQALHEGVTLSEACAQLFWSLGPRP